MSAYTKRRIERLADDMQELADSSHRLFGFSLICGSKGTRIRIPRKWERIVSHFTVRRTENLVFTKHPYWAEVHPDFTRCIWWWGDLQGIEQFKQWMERMSSVVQDDAGLLNDVQAEQGGFQLLVALCRFAREQARRPDLVRRRVLRISKSLLDQQMGSDEKPGGSKFLMNEVTAPAPVLALAIVKCILGEPVSGPRLTVDRKKNLAILDGIPCQMIRELIFILDVLIKANGSIVSAADIKEQAPALKKVERLDRLINRDLARKCPEVRKAIENVPKKGYRIRREYLA